LPSAANLILMLQAAPNTLWRNGSLFSPPCGGLDEIAQRHLSSDSAMPLAHRSSAAQKAMIAKRVVIID
jgi:hypothetical protein